MPLLRFQVAAWYDSVLPRDAVVNTLHFDVTGPTDADQLCEDLANVFLTGWYANAPQIVVTAYEVGGAPPHYPVGRYEANTGNSPGSNCPREVALALSFYSQRNIPRQRGRIFLFFGGTSFSPALRPAAARMSQALALANAFASLGGANVAWVVYSPTDQQGRGVSNAWVDDEWDTMRSRGLRGTTRVMSAPGS